ncbi:MAG: HAD family hydrolase [Sutterella wadsworthensis]
MTIPASTPRTLPAMTAFRPVPATGFMPLAAVFDLDHTLIAGDATIGWTEYLYERGVVTDPVFREINERMKASYHAGTLDIAAWLREAVPAYSGLDEAERNALVLRLHRGEDPSHRLSAGLETIRAAKARACLRSSSPPNALLREPIAERVFGVDVALGTELVVRNATSHARASGTPTFREGKVVRLCAALGTGVAPRRDGLLHRQPQRPALALASGDCVAVNPDPVRSRPLARTDGQVNAWKL